LIGGTDGKEIQNKNATVLCARAEKKGHQWRSTASAAVSSQKTKYLVSGARSVAIARGSSAYTRA
jgi:hypothetical protein